MSTYDVIGEAVKMYEAGQSIKQIAEELSRAPSTIYAWLQDADVVLKKDRPNISTLLDEGLVNQVVQDYVRGVSVAKIIRVTSLSQNTIYKILDEKEVPLRRSEDFRKVVDKRLDQAVQMYKDGSKLIKIEVETGVQSTQLYKELYKQGVPLRRDIP